MPNIFPLSHRPLAGGPVQLLGVRPAGGCPLKWPPASSAPSGLTPPGVSQWDEGCDPIPAPDTSAPVGSLLRLLGEEPAQPGWSPGGDAPPAAHVPESRAEDGGFDYCEECWRLCGDLQAFSDHLTARHAAPPRLPSQRYYGDDNPSEAIKKRPYTELYPCKKRKAKSDRVPRPQNQYMIFSNYVREPLMNLFRDVNSARISRTISQMWKKLSPEVKLYYKQESKRCEDLHRIEYPNYRYQPKQKKAKKSEGPTPASKQEFSQNMGDVSPTQHGKHFDTSVSASLPSMSSQDHAAHPSFPHGDFTDVEGPESIFSQLSFTGVPMPDNATSTAAMVEYSNATVVNDLMGTSPSLITQTDPWFSEKCHDRSSGPAFKQHPCFVSGTASAQSSLESLLHSSTTSEQYSLQSVLSPTTRDQVPKEFNALSP